MKCDICENCVPGIVYWGEGICNCSVCGSEIDVEGQQLYLGTNEETKTHDFRLVVSKRCSGCGARIFLVRNQCAHEEFEKGIENLFGINQSQSNQSNQSNQSVDRFTGYYEDRLGDGYE